MTNEAVMFVIFLILFNIFSYKMAQTRGRNVYGWLATSLILSPLVAWLALLFLGKTEEKEQEEFNRLHAGMTSATVEYK